MIDSIIFDAEGVVIDTEEMWDRAQVELLARRGMVYDREYLKPMLTGRSSLEGARVLCDVLGLEDSPEALARERATIMQQVLGDNVAFVGGFLDFYASVRERFKTSVATAMDTALLKSAEEALGLYELFDGLIVTLDDVGGVGKPAPDLFLEAARRMGSSPERCIVIEDAPNGIEAARRGGMRSVGLTTTHSAEQLFGADQVCQTFNEIDLSEEALRRAAPTSRRTNAQVVRERR